MDTSLAAAGLEKQLTPDGGPWAHDETTKKEEEVIFFGTCVCVCACVWVYVCAC